MRIFTFIIFILQSNFLFAGVSRAPAVVNEQCDLNIATNKILEGSEKTFSSKVTHFVTIRSSDQYGCSTLEKKRYPDTFYEENVKNEMQVLFLKYPEKFSQSCVDHFKKLGLKAFEYSCDQAEIESIYLSNYHCEKNNEEDTQKITYSATAEATVSYKQTGKKYIEKAVDVVQKEQCTRVNECIEQASDKELPELRKLAAVACRVDLVPVNTARAPALEKDTSFDGNRQPKNNDPSNSNKEEQNKTPTESGAVLK